ncbi:MAG: hypothetical protein Q7S53_01015 [bacterium]|nr:hypothetical protein [bacterium]
MKKILVCFMLVFVALLVIVPVAWSVSVHDSVYDPPVDPCAGKSLAASLSSTSGPAPATLTVTATMGGGTFIPPAVFIDGTQDTGVMWDDPAAETMHAQITIPAGASVGVHTVNLEASDMDSSCTYTAPLTYEVTGSAAVVTDPVTQPISTPETGAAATVYSASAPAATTVAMAPGGGVKTMPNTGAEMIPLGLLGSGISGLGIGLRCLAGRRKQH